VGKRARRLLPLPLPLPPHRLPLRRSLLLPPHRLPLCLPQIGGP
jgi:hypothetical protein